MSSRTRTFAAVSVAGLAICLTLTGCGPQAGAAPSPAASVAETTAPTPIATAAVSSPTTPTPENPAALEAPAPETLAPEAPAEPAAPVLNTYTFPDGHISFTYPASWIVQTKFPPAGVSGVEAIVADGTGNELATIGYGFITGCAAGPTNRVVFDQAPVPGMAAGGTAPLFGFAVESYSSGDDYSMGLSDPEHLEQGENVTSQCRLLITPSGGLNSSALFNDPEFPSRAAAQAWMATEQYAQLKAVLVSLTYS